MAGNRGQYSKSSQGTFHPTYQAPDQNGQMLISDTETRGGSKYLKPSPTSSVSPFASLGYNMGGVYVGKRALDKWRFSTAMNRTVCILGDSTAQGAIYGADGWPERLARVLGTDIGPRLSAGAGYYGMYRSGTTLTYNNSDSEWDVSGPWATSFTQNWAVVPYSGTIIMTGSAMTTAYGASTIMTDTGAATTVNSRTLTTVTAGFFQTYHVDLLITGPNIPPNTYIVGRNSATSVILSQPASATAAGQTITIHPGSITWTRPIGTNNVGKKSADGVSTNASATYTSNFFNFRSMHIGLMITGTNIPAGTTISAVAADGLSCTLSQNATATGIGLEFIVHDGRSVADAATTNASAVVTSATALFSNADINARVVGTNIPSGTYILSVQSPTQATLSANATATGSSQFLFVHRQNAARYCTDMTTTAGSATVVSASAAFTKDDEGKQVTGSWVPNNTTIISVTNSTTAVLSSVMPYAYTTCATLGISATNPVNIQELDILWVDGITLNGGNFSYSTDGGQTWTNQAQTTTGGPKMSVTKVMTLNPATIIIRSYSATNTFGQTVQCGILAYQQPSAQMGFTLYNVAKDGQTLTSATSNGAADPLAVFDNTQGGTFPGLRPDLIIVLFTNDIVTYDAQRWHNAINRLIARVNSYADILFLSTFEQYSRDPGLQKTFAKILKKAALSTNPPYWYCPDVVTTSASAAITATTFNFTQSDVGKTITGNGIPTGTTISSVTSGTAATMSQNATASATIYAEITTGLSPDTANAVIDLAEAWDAEASGNFTGYQNANSDGLMADTVHESQIGHNEIARRVFKVLGMF